MSARAFKIIENKATRSGSIPNHWDICPHGQDDSTVTVWESKEMADEIAAYLEHRAKFKAWIAERGAHDV